MAPGKIGSALAAFEANINKNQQLGGSQSKSFLGNLAGSVNIEVENILAIIAIAIDTESALKKTQAITVKKKVEKICMTSLKDGNSLCGEISLIFVLFLFKSSSGKK